MTPRSAFFVLPVLTLLLAGCHIVEHKDGDKKSVDIGTPFGSMHVNTNDKEAVAAIGITPYPGAVPYKDSASDKDHDSANVDMSFGDFHLGVKAASFLTQDSEDKVLAFYRKDLTRYSDVIECRGSAPVGSPTRTTQGLTCNDKDSSNKTHIDTESSLELRAGSPSHIHLIGVERKPEGLKIGLVALDLPSNLTKHSDKEIE